MCRVGFVLCRVAEVEEMARWPMEAVMFIGIQGSGKSSYFKERFFSTHVRISLDQLKNKSHKGHMLRCRFFAADCKIKDQFR